MTNCMTAGSEFAHCLTYRVTRAWKVVKHVTVPCSWPFFFLMSSSYHATWKWDGNVFSYDSTTGVLTLCDKSNCDRTWTHTNSHHVNKSPVLIHSRSRTPNSCKSSWCEGIRLSFIICSPLAPCECRLCILYLLSYYAANKIHFQIKIHFQN